MNELETLSVLAADRRREFEAAAESSRLTAPIPARRVAAGALRRLADAIDTPRAAAPRPGLGTGRGS